MAVAVVGRWWAVGDVDAGGLLSGTLDAGVQARSGCQLLRDTPACCPADCGFGDRKEKGELGWPSCRWPCVLRGCRRFCIAGDGGGSRADEATAEAVAD